MQRHIQQQRMRAIPRPVVETAGEVERRQAITRLRQLIEHGDRSGKLTGAMAKKLAATVEVELGQTEWVG